MSKYSCPLCAKTFSQKIDFTRHTNKKAPCISVEEIQNRVQATVQATVKTNDDIQLFKNIFDNCLDIMRDGGGLTGEKALRNLGYLMVLKLLEPRMDEIGIDTHDYEWSVEDHLVETHKKKLLSIVRFRNLVNEPEENIKTNLTFLWEDVLSQHPATAKIFLKGKGFDIRDKKTYKKLISKLSEVDLTQGDALAQSYQNMIKHIMTGKVLGQFFTEPVIRKKMVKIVNPQVYPDGTIETCCDPTMGTGGFLTSYLADVSEKAKTQNVTLDWDFITNEGIYGKDLEPDTYQLAMSNMLISTGKMFDKLDCGDSIREPISRKFDIILANPPFGIKGLKYDEFVSDMKSQYLPIKTDNAVSLFIQAIICMLKVGGRCAVVLPDGQDLFSKSGAYVLIREYLMKTCDLKEVYYLRAGVFTNTTIKTCVFHFVKKREGTDVLDVKIKTNATQKETGREYKFSKTHQTTKVKFYEYDDREDIDHLLKEVSIEEIAENAYSMNYAEYMKGDEVEEEYEEGVVMKTLGEVFGEKNNNFISIDDNTQYNVVGLSSKGYSKVSKEIFGREIKMKRQQLCKTTQFAISKILNGCYGFINNDTSGGIISTEYWLFQINTNIINGKYLYYVFENQILTKLKQISNGVGIPRINYNNFKSIKIPIPTLEKQLEIVSYLDFIYETANKTSKEKIAELKQLNAFCLKHQHVFGDNVVRTMGEVCKFQNGYSFKSADYEKQNKTNVGILQIKSIQNGFIDEKKISEYIGENSKYKLFEIQKGDMLIALTGATTGKIGIYNLDTKSYLNQRVGKITANTNIQQKYIYYWYVCCNIDEEILRLAQGTAQPNISTNDISKIKIPIPSLERQQEIVAYCERNEALIRDLEAEIEQNKQMASQFLSSVLHITQNEYVDEVTENASSYTNNLDVENNDEDETPSDEYKNSHEEEPSPISPTIVRSGEKKTIRISKKSP